MNFFLKKEIVEIWDEIASLKGRYPFYLMFGPFPKKMLNLTDVLNNDGLSIEYKKIFPKEVIRRNLPKTIEKNIHKKFYENQVYTISERFVLLMKGAHVAFKECFIITKKGFIIEELNLLMGRKKSPIFHKRFFPKVRLLSGNVCVLSNFDNYFHWMTDVLPRIMLVKNLGCEINYYITGTDINFKKESLKAVGIAENKLLPSSDQMNLAPTVLIAPSSYSNQGNPTKKICLFLRNIFLKREHSCVGKRYSKIYVRRGNSKERKVINEKEVEDFLVKIGFISVTMDGMSISEQARIFNNAKVIVSAHGAALTNIVFCKKGTKVIEIFSHNYLNICYWSIANLVNLNYIYFFGEKVFGLNTGFNMKISIKKLELALAIDA